MIKGQTMIQKSTQNTKDRTTRTPLKTEVVLGISRTVSSPSSTSDTSSVTLITH